LTFNDITHVLLTHIHLDHAGAAGFLASQGAQVLVHEIGAPHMCNPEKLMRSATRIYGNMMETLWGEFLPVPEENLTSLSGEGEFNINEITIQYLDTPGHAFHHLVYIIGNTCFTGDVGGVRLPGPLFLRLPTPPPEFHIESWRVSIEKMKTAGFSHIAPTHFGIFDQADKHLETLEQTLLDVELWMESTLPDIQERVALQEIFTQWEHIRCRAAGLNDDSLYAYSLAMPIGMGADGVWRYWNKYRTDD
jgi:glyoxylase-like metal-dependent hydrolase (beta-lactamase superfamily II)